MILVAMLFCGLQNINVLSFDIVKMIGLILVLLSSIVLPQGANVVVGVTLGLGTYLCGGNLEYITYFSILSIVSLLFRENRILGLLAILLGDVMLNFFLNLFGNITIFTFMPTIIACAIFAFIPKNMINKIKFNLYVDKSTNSLKTILNQNKLQTSKKLLYTAEIFYEMDKSFRKLVKGTISEKDAKTMLCGELIRTNCESCPNKARCLKGYNNDLRKIFDNLINAGFEKGKITLVDLPQYLTLRCVKLNQLVNSINSLLNDYKSYAKLNLDIDSSKLLVAEQLKGVSHILNELSKETNQVVSQDEKQQILIKENLIYQDIVPSEVICFEKDEKTSIVSLLIRTIDYDNEKILNVINSITNSKMMLDEILPSNDQNMTYVSYKTAPTYDMAIGLAHMTKGGSEKSGDTHSFSRLSSGKFMLALCDGMGSGSKANEKSETSINLIENFYKAGYDDETILSSVNKLLNLTSENVFSALDVSVIDLKNGEADFIKQGATVGFVKTGDKVSKIESSGLPIGILDDVSPKVTKTILSPDDQLIMLSDGVVDAFGEDNLQEFLKYVRTKSPQELADTILNKAKEVQKNYPNDDMTVLVGKLYYNCA
jgi:stage II sporulation protein E